MHIGIHTVARVTGNDRIGHISGLKFMSFRNLLLQLETAVWDGIYGIKTLGCAPGKAPAGAADGDAVRFQSKCFFHIKRILRQFPMTGHDVFYDIGCGSGRVVCISAQKKITRCVGIELSRDLSELARRNGSNLRFRKAAIEIIQADASAVDYSAGTVFWLYDPFGARTLTAVLERIRSSLADAPRKITFVYLNPTQRQVFHEQKWLKQIGVYHAPLSAAEVLFYNNEIGQRQE
ncbi:MAG: class I SAM-dependent methyltransferase [Limisphaerales bacterium]